MQCSARSSVSVALAAVITLSFAGCDSGAVVRRVDGGGTDGGGGERAPYHPANPAGLGPAAVDLGAATNLAAAGSFVLLAKTGITNVTGSSISGGHVGLSPAAASFITGFSLIDDSTTKHATSASVVAPA